MKASRRGTWLCVVGLIGFLLVFYGFERPFSAEVKVLLLLFFVVGLLGGAISFHASVRALRTGTRNE